MPTIPISQSKKWKPPEVYARTQKDSDTFARTIHKITPIVHLRIGTLVYPVAVELTCGHKVEHHVHAKAPKMHVGGQLFCSKCEEAANQ